MARVGGRNALFAWVVGIGCAATVAVLAALALPLMPAALTWVGTTADQAPVTSAPVAAGGDEASDALPTECSGLYDDAQWAALRFTRDAVLTPSTNAPTTTAESLIAALQPQVLLTCSWHAEQGTVVTTLATVPTDAGAIAAAALPGSGFACTAEGERTRCTRTDGGLTETIEAGGGLWLSTSEYGWHPAGYIDDVARGVWG